MVPVILALLLTVLAGPAWATDRYVSTTGSDSNSCAASENIATPKLTMVSAAGCMVGGDELFIRGGTYTGSSNAFVNTIPSGTAGARTKITAYQGELVTLRPSGVQNVILLIDDSYITVTGLHLDGVNTTHHTLRPTGNSDHLIFQDGEVTDQNKGTSFETGHSCIQGGGDSTVSSDFGQILNSHIHHCGFNSFDHGIYITYGKNWIVRGNEVDGMSGFGLHIYPEPLNWLIEKNYIHDNCNVGSCGEVVLSNRGHTFRRNVIARASATGSNTGIQVQYGAAGGDDMIIDHNTLYQAGSVGIHLPLATAANNTIRNNHIVGSPTPILNNGTNTTLTANRTTGSLLDCAVSTSDFSQKSDSVCIDAGTIISGLPYSGFAPDIGLGESFTPVSATISTHFLDITFNAIHTPISSISGEFGWSVTCSPTCGGSPVVSAVSLLGGSGDVLRLDISGISGIDCVAGKTWTVHAAAGVIQDSTLIGQDNSDIFRNQLASSFTNYPVTNNCGAASTGYPGTPYIFYNMNDNNGVTLTNGGSGGAGLSGTLIGGPAWGTGKSGAGVITTAGTSQYIAIPYGNGINPTTQNLTIAFGVKVPASSVTASRGEFGVSVGTDQRYHVASVSGTHRLGLQISPANASASNLTVRPEWNHLCINSNAATGTVSLFLDGVKGTGGAEKTATSYILSSNFTLGRYDINPAPGGTYDDLLIYQSLEDCAAIYAAFEPASSVTGTFAQTATRFQGVYRDTSLNPIDFGTAINQPQEVVADGAVAVEAQVHCQPGADCSPAAFRLEYSRNGSASFVGFSNAQTSDNIWMWGLDSNVYLNSGVTTTRLTGSCTVTNGVTILTASQADTFDLPADGCVVLRYIVRVGNNVGDYYDLRVVNQNGVVFTGGYSLARLTVVPPRASAGF